jgi:hypothetical protein
MYCTFLIHHCVLLSNSFWSFRVVSHLHWYSSHYLLSCLMPLHHFFVFFDAATGISPPLSELLRAQFVWVLLKHTRRNSHLCNIMNRTCKFRSRTSPCSYSNWFPSINHPCVFGTLFSPSFFWSYRVQVVSMVISLFALTEFIYHTAYPIGILFLPLSLWCCIIPRKEQRCEQGYDKRVAKAKRQRPKYKQLDNATDGRQA